MTWVVLSSALSGAMIGGFYFRSAVVVMTSVQISIFLVGLYLTGEIDGFRLTTMLLAGLSSHQAAYFLAFVARVYATGDRSSTAPLQTPSSFSAVRGLGPGVGERFDEVVILADEIERRAPQVSTEAANVTRLVREIRTTLEERRANVFR